MPFRSQVDLRLAVNAISDVVQNRPRPLRKFDQIYMKAGDMVSQSEIVADWAHDRRLAFVGDGDAISVCVAYLRNRGIIDFGPSHITVFDFDERIVGAITRFADKARIDNLDAKLYNCIDAIPASHGGGYDCFYTNPPWGESNGGASVHVFAQRGMELAGFEGEGMIVIADDDELEWPKRVLASTQAFAGGHGYYVSRMMPRLHEYHLDVELKSCNLIVAALPDNAHRHGPSTPIIDPDRLRNFYGRSQEPRVRYVRERKRLDYGMAPDEEYSLEMIEATDE